MNILLKKSKIEDEKLRRYIVQKTSEELSKLSEPCYFPKWKGEYYELLNLTGLDESDMKDFIKRFHVRTKSNDRILLDIGNNILLFIMYYYLLKKDEHTALFTVMLMNIKFYGSRLKIHLPQYCNIDIFKYTLDNLSKTHLFLREKTISNAVVHLSREIMIRFQKDLKVFNDPDRISTFLYECRHRIAQSVKSFAQLYHHYSETGGGYKSVEDTDDKDQTKEPEPMKRGQVIIDNVLSKLVVYHEEDKLAYENSKKLSKINTLFADLIVKELYNQKYADKVRFIYELYIRGISDIKELCGIGYIVHVKLLMSVKRINKPVYFKKEIVDLTNELISTNSKIQKEYSNLTQQTQFLIALFTALYLTNYFRNMVCK